MTDNEVVSDFEIILNDLEDRVGHKTYETLKQSFDLIDRQKAEIERLTDSNRRLRDDMRMMLNNDNGSDQIRTEAIKEFAERLKTRIKNALFCCYDLRFKNHLQELLKIIVAKIDNLVKEMTESGE